MSNNWFEEWTNKINWNDRVKSVCKPCWELKYCPYGILVEDFPLEENPTEKSCRIYGHNCPVFSVAEPLTETKELRNISRAIPREIQFKVVARDKNICQICGKNVLDDDIHFDHIIPWSKGGPTEISNIRLLCSDCNLQRSNNFENEFLVNDSIELTSEPMDIETVSMYLDTIEFYHCFNIENNQIPTVDDYETAEFVEDMVNKFIQLFEKNDYDIRPKMFTILENRWGIKDSKVKSIKEIKLSDQENQELFYSEIKLFSCIGIYLNRNKNSYKKWLKQKVGE